MKNTRFLLLILFALVLESSDGSRVIRVAYPDNFYPYCWRDSTGRPKGFLIDWWNLWAGKVDARLEFIGASNEACINLVMKDSADVLAGMFFEMGMKDRLQFGEYIMRLKSVLFLKNGYKPASPELIAKPIGIIRNEFSEKLVRQRFPGIPLLYFDRFIDLRDKIRTGVISGFIYEYPDIRGPYKEIPPPKGYYQYVVLRTDKIRPAVKEGNDPMIRLLMVGAAQISDREVEQMVDRYALLKKESQFPWNGVIIALTLLIVAAVFLFVLARFRRRRMREELSPAEEWRMIIAQGESDSVEFKSSMRWDYRQQKVNKTLEYVIAKTLSAFLNTGGGMLFIGVDDKGTPIGLTPDYDTLSKKNSDGFLLALTDVVNRYLGKEFHRFISTRIIPADGQEICMVTIEKSDAPVFVETGNGQEFFIRTPASSQPLNMREAMEYISSHWGKKG